MSSVGRHGGVICGEVGCSDRQLDYWVRCGFLGDDIHGRGSGTRRRWTYRHAEIAWAIARVSDFGGIGRGGMDLDKYRTGFALVAERPVDPAGELLLLRPHEAHRAISHVATVRPENAPLLIIGLRSFAHLADSRGGITMQPQQASA